MNANESINQTNCVNLTYLDLLNQYAKFNLYNKKRNEMKISKKKPKKNELNNVKGQMQVYIEKRDSHKQRKTKTKHRKQKTCIGYKNKCSITFRIS